MGSYYARLTEVANLDYNDAEELAQYEKVAELIQDCRDAATRYLSDPGFHGKTATAALNWMADYQTRLETKATELQTTVERHNLAREAMLTAKAEHDKLSPQLLTAFERKLLPINGPYILDGREVSGSEYTAHLAAERDAAREAAAKRILTAMNTKVSDQLHLIDTPTDTRDPGSPSASNPSRPSIKTPSVSPPHLVTKRPKDPGGSGSGPSTPGDYPPAVQPVPTPRPNPVAGYEPPSVLHRDDPAWSDSYTRPPALGAGGAVAGGIIGAGARALAARSAASGLSGNAALALQNAAGPGSASTLGRAGLGAASTAAGRVPGGGILSNTNAAATGKTAKAGSGAAARRGDSNRAKPAADTSRGLIRRDGAKKANRKREQAKGHGYLAESLDESSDAATIAGPGAAAGTAAELTPLPTPDDGDRW